MHESKIVSCRYCGNLSRMKVVGGVTEDLSHFDPDYGYNDYGIHYSVLRCYACNEVSIISYDVHPDIESEDDISYMFLYPQKTNYPPGLPDSILKAYKAAEKVKNIDVNAYAILMRRLLELVCIERGALSKNLAQMLGELARKEEIPDKLVEVAKGLKDFGNIGAHAGSGELTQKEVPTITALGKAVLEYVYEAPYLATLAEKELNNIRSKK